LQGARVPDAAGASVSGGGDFNGDGLPDLIVGSPSALPSGRLPDDTRGAAYVIFGGDPGRLRIVPDGHSASYTDTDGDLVTVRTSNGKFTKGMFDLHPQGLGFQLQALHLTDPAFAHANLT